VREHRGASWRRALGAGQRTLHVEHGRLLAPGAQAGGQRGEVGGAIVPVERCHLDDDGRHDRVQAVGELEKVATVRSEAMQVVDVVEVQAAGEGRQHQAEPEHVGDLVMMAQPQLPAAEARQEHRALDRCIRVRLHVQRMQLFPPLGRMRATQFPDDVERRCGVRLHAMDRVQGTRRRATVRLRQPQRAAGVVEHQRGGIQRSDAAGRVQRRDLFEQRQHQHQDIIGGQRGAGLRVEEGGQGGRGGCGGVVAHACTAAAFFSLSISRLPRPASRLRTVSIGSRLPSAWAVRTA
jgi:hypothetical protein